MWKPFTSLLDAEQGACQKDQFVKDIYSMLFAFTVTCNHRMVPSTKDAPPPASILYWVAAMYMDRMWCSKRRNDTLTVTRRNIDIGKLVYSHFVVLLYVVNGYV